MLKTILGILLILIILVIFIDLRYGKKLENFNTNLMELPKFNQLGDLIKPSQIINPNRPIAIVIQYTSNIYDYVKHNITNLLVYAKKFNYTVIIYDKLLNNIASPCWSKVLAVLANLSNYNYLIWLDADAIICNHDISFESIIQEEPDKDLLLCTDIFVEKECINSGVMIIKNTEWAFNLFKKTWDNPTPHTHNDQNVLFIEIVKDIKPDTNPPLKNSPYCILDINPKVKIFSQNKFNSHICYYLQNDFIIHLMGISSDKRINIMRQINTKLGLDDYDNKSCIDVLDYLGIQPYSKIKDSIIAKFCFS